MANCLLSSLLCAEDNDSICYDDNDDQNNVDVGLWGYGNQLISNQSQCFVKNHETECCVLDFPVQSDECLFQLIEKECEHFVGFDYLKKLKNGNLDHIVARQQSVDWIRKVHAHFNFGPLCAYLSINYMDRFLAAYDFPKDKSWMMQLLAVSCISLASKMEETEIPLILDLQETAIRKTIPILKHTIRGITNQDLFFGQIFKIADLGCSSGKNTLFVASNIMDLVTEVCEENNRKSPQFHVCLNDLYGNDFNTLFKLLPHFYAKIKKKGEKFGRCFVSAVPGSFYHRLFPDQSLHLVHSSYSVHWLSQVPEGLESNALNIYMSKTSPPNVFQAYGKQFKTDFTKFLQMRSEEIVCDGRMILTLVGRSVADPTSDDGCCLWELLAQSLLDMAKEGHVRESDINSFNVPIYYPCEDEVRNIIQNEGSFSLESLTTFKVNWDPQDKDYKNLKDSDGPSPINGENTAKAVRAFAEPLLTFHFGESIIDGVFNKYKKHVAQHLISNKTRFFNLVISLAKS